MPIEWPSDSEEDLRAELELAEQRPKIILGGREVIVRMPRGYDTVHVKVLEVWCGHHNWPLS
jgi:hypothetical protein